MYGENTVASVAARVEVVASNTSALESSAKDSHDISFACTWNNAELFNIK
jgi:hypothetical protein